MSATTRSVEVKNAPLKARVRGGPGHLHAKTLPRSDAAAIVRMRFPVSMRDKRRMAAWLRSVAADVENAKDGTFAPLYTARLMPAGG